MAGKQPLRIVSLLLGLFYALFIEYGTFPLNLGGSIFFIMLLLTLGALYKREKILTLLSGVTGVVGMGIATYLSITTTPLMVILNSITIVFITMVLFLNLYERKSPGGATEYLASCMRWIRDTIIQSVTLENIKDFFSLHISLNGKTIKRDYVLGSLFAFPLLWIFHLLFSQINNEYVYFMSHILKWIGDIIHYIIELDILQTALKTLVIGYFLFIALITRKENSEDLKTEKTYNSYDLVKIIVGSLVILFATFSYFQGKLITTVNFASLAFKDLSLYTQHGFWELLLISAIGYILSLIFIKFIHHKSSIFSLKHMLLCYVGELILICLFSYHKLYVLQSIFGFKDQRILATAAVSLIFMTFIVFVARIVGKISVSSIFSIQRVVLIVTVLILNIINIDSLATTTNPIRYYIGKTSYLDYSYLLGNSYDNNSMWLFLMHDAEKKGIPYPSNYYWGYYKSLCSNDWEAADWNSVWGTEYPSYIEKRYKDLGEKYQTRKAPREIMKQIGSFNLHEYEAYTTLKTHKSEVMNFLKFVYKSCGYANGSEPRRLNIY